MTNLKYHLFIYSVTYCLQMKLQVSLEQAIISFIITDAAIVLSFKESAKKNVISLPRLTLL